MRVNYNRINWVDALKGVSILWLIIYHFYIFDWLVSPVPVFFFLSGLFYSDGNFFRTFVTHKAKALLVPFVFFYVIGLVPILVINVINGQSYDFTRLVKFITLIPINSNMTNPLGVGAIWFLLSLFELYLLFYIMRRITKNKFLLIMISVLLLLVSSVLANHYAMGSLLYLIYSLGFLIYFTLGFVMKSYFINKSGRKISDRNKTDAYLLCFSVIGMLMWFIPLEGTLFFIRDRIAGIGLVITLVILFIRLDGLFNNNSRTYSFLLFEGRNSLTILGTHLIAVGGHFCFG